MQTLRNTSQGSSSALVIGGGIVGLATAYALCQQSIRVTVLDDAAVDHRASSATAGIIGGSSVIPWANSKLWPRLPLHFLDQDGPLRMALPFPKGLPSFFKQSVVSGRGTARAQSAAGLANLGLRGWDAWQELLTDLPSAKDLFVQQGCLFYYEIDADQSADANANALRRSFGMDLTDLNNMEMEAILPPLSRPVAGGVRVNSAGHVLDPVGLQRRLVKAIEAGGGAIIQQRVSKLVSQDGRITSVVTNGTHFDADSVILCAGSGSAELAKPLGLNIPMIPAWGASVTFTNAAVDLRTPILLLKDGIAVTPSTEGLRVSGLLQVGGAGRAQAMIKTLKLQAKRLFGAFAYDEITTCIGPRPLSADSLAFLGPDPSHDNLFHNFGHGHWGLTQASISAQITADLVLGNAPKFDMSAYRTDRY
jgi:glycine/D-amino acid oxidase-like deaminating enzyme